METPSTPRARATVRLAVATFVLAVATVIATGTGISVAGARTLQTCPTSTTADPSTSTTVDPCSTTTVPTTVPPTVPPTTTPPAPPTTRPPAPPAPPAGPPGAPSSRGWSVRVHLARQHAYVYQNGNLVKDIPISSGAGGKTPRGTFRVGSKSRITSAEGGPSVTMQFMTRFNKGIGFHGIPRKNGRPLATPLGQRPVSHGCIRMADENAQWVFNTVPSGSTVLVK